MLKTLFPILLLISSAAAQSFPKAEVFAGYEYANENQFLGGSRVSLNGWNASIGVNMSRWFGIATDFSGVYGSSNGSILVIECAQTSCQDVSVPTSEDSKLHSFLVGPQFSLRSSKWTLFGHMLVGGEKENVDDTIYYPSGSGFTTGTSALARPSTVAFQLAVGGGADYKIRRNLAWRLQSDYFTLGSQNNVRVSSGIVFTVGQ